MNRTPPQRAARRAQAVPAKHSLAFSRVNAILGGSGILSVVLGYVFLAQGSITAAPLLLVLGYVVLLPAAIIK